MANDPLIQEKLCECGCGEPAPLATRTRSDRGWVRGQPVRFISGHHLRMPEYKAMIFTPERNRKISEAHADGRIPNPTPKSGAANPMWKGNDISYSHAHLRLEKSRGPASEYTCAVCFKPAEEWAINHEHPSIRFGNHGGRRKPYSPIPAAYVALCRSCHRSADRKGGYRG